MTLPVYVDPQLTAATVGGTFALTGEEAHHAATVRRTRTGESVDVVNGRGLRVTIEVTGVDKARMEGTVTAVVQEPAHPIHITLVQALAKGGRDEQAVETATEYGVDAVIPWQADRSIVRWAGPKAAKGRARWEATALAAAKQSRRSWVPAVSDVVTSRDLAKWIEGSSTAPGEAGRVLVCHEEATTKVTEVDISGPVTLIVGPEGGISPEEMAAYEAAGATPVLLGEHVLRSASAGPWAIAVLRALHG